MRSIFAHLKNCNKQKVIRALDDICDRPNGTTGVDWICEKNGDSVLYVGFYSDYQQYEPKDWKRVLDRLGQEPIITVTADVSGRHPGRPEVIAFLASLFDKFEGVAQDDWEQVWKIEEILDDARLEGRRYFDY